MKRKLTDFIDHCRTILNNLEIYESSGHEKNWLLGMTWAWTNKLIGATQNDGHRRDNACILSENAKMRIARMCYDHPKSYPSDEMALICINESIISAFHFEKAGEEYGEVN